VENTLDKNGATRRGAWPVFALLFALMVVDYIDRQILVSILPQLKIAWGLSDTELGGLVSIVPITVALGVMPLSLLADRWSRVKCIFLMALIWSSATVACALASSYGQLLAARGVVGLGEAAYGTAGAALVAGLFPPRLRSTMLAAFLAAAVIGSALGVMLGGIISVRWGWPAAFGAAGAPGVVLAILFWLLARDSKVSLGASSAQTTLTLGNIARQLLSSRTALAACVGGGLQLLVVSSMYAWLPSYLNRYHDLPPDLAGVRTGWVVLIGGLGAVIWSIIADRLTVRLPCARLYVPATAAIMTSALMCGAFIGASPRDHQFWLLAAGGAVMTGTVGSVAAVIIDVSPPGLRATATSILALIQNLLGLALGPLLTGTLADVYGLRFALSVVPAFSLLAAVMFALAARTYVTDMRAVEGWGQVHGGIWPQHR
jgi:MFS family permease